MLSLDHSHLKVLNVLDNDVDSDGDQLSVSAILYDANNGLCKVHDDGASVSYTPNPGYQGQDICVYSACDKNNACGTAAVTITIQASLTDGSNTEESGREGNTAPTAVDDFATTKEFQPIFVNVVANDIDIDGDVLTLAPVVIPCRDGGIIQIIGDGSGGVVEYTPASEFSGMDSCKYTVCDSLGACDRASLIVTVVSVTLPPIAENDERMTDVNTPIEIYVTDNDMSPNDLPLTIAKVQVISKQGGAVSIIGNETSVIVMYEPAVDFVGNDQFCYTSEYLAFSSRPQITFHRIISTLLSYFFLH